MGNGGKWELETATDWCLSGTVPVLGDDSVILTLRPHVWFHYLSVGDFIPQVVPEMSELGQRLLDHVPVRLIWHLLQQQLPLVAELLHVNLLLVNFHLVLLLGVNGQTRGGRSGKGRRGEKCFISSLYIHDPIKEFVNMSNSYGLVRCHSKYYNAKFQTH